MRSLYGIALAGALVAGIASDAHAQLSVSIGNPYTGSGVVIGNNSYGVNNPYGYGAYAPGYGTYPPGYGRYSPSGYAGSPLGYSTPGYTTSYSSSYYGLAPSTSTFSSGYSGYAPQVYGAAVPSYSPYGYSSYGYRGVPGVYLPLGRPTYRPW